MIPLYNIVFALLCALAPPHPYTPPNQFGQSTPIPFEQLLSADRAANFSDRKVKSLTRELHTIMAIHQTKPTSPELDQLLIDSATRHQKALIEQSSIHQRRDEAATLALKSWVFSITNQ